MVKDGADEDLGELLLDGPRQRGSVLRRRFTLRRGRGSCRPSFHPGRQTTLQQQSVATTARSWYPARLQDLRAQLLVTCLPHFVSQFELLGGDRR